MASPSSSTEIIFETALLWYGVSSAAKGTEKIPQGSPLGDAPLSSQERRVCGPSSRDGGCQATAGAIAFPSRPAAADALRALKLCNSSAQDPVWPWGNLPVSQRAPGPWPWVLLACSEALPTPSSGGLRYSHMFWVFFPPCLSQIDFFRRNGNGDYKAV